MSFDFTHFYFLAQELYNGKPTQAPDQKTNFLSKFYEFVK